jgi:hypothetical protein
MHVKSIKSGGFQLIGTGSFITYNEDAVEIKFGDEDDTLTLKLCFQAGPNRHLEAETHGDKLLCLKLIGFEKGYDEGNVKPIQIGVANGKTIYFNFRTSKLSQGQTRLVHYSLYQHA